LPAISQIIRAAATHVRRENQKWYVKRHAPAEFASVRDASRKKKKKLPKKSLRGMGAQRGGMRGDRDLRLLR
jgi:hypothetical protein